jgi:hypothetical protein
MDMSGCYRSVTSDYKHIVFTLLLLLLGFFSLSFYLIFYLNYKESKVIDYISHTKQNKNKSLLGI